MTHWLLIVKKLQQTDVVLLYPKNKKNLLVKLQRPTQNNYGQNTGQKGMQASPMAHTDNKAGCRNNRRLHTKAINCAAQVHNASLQEHYKHERYY